MGVDFDAEGGLGIRITKDILDKLHYDEAKEDMEDFIEKQGIPYIHFGSYYSGEVDYAFVVEGETYKEIKANIPSFIGILQSKDIHITEDDLELIAELLIW